MDSGARIWGMALWEGPVLQEAFLCGEESANVHVLDPRFFGVDVELIVVEVMRILPVGAQGRRGAQQDLIDVSVRAGWLCGLVEARGGRWAQYLPSQWKGGLKKPVTRLHAERVLSSRETAGIAVLRDKKKQSDVWDAVCMGLTHCGRMPWRIRTGRYGGCPSVAA